MKQFANNNIASEQQSLSYEKITKQFLTFTVGKEEFGIDIMIVKEIKSWTNVTRLPNSPHYMLGVMNLRGIIIPIFDLRARFNMGSTEITSKHVAIILVSESRTIGILVDSVSDILNVDYEEIKPPLEIESKIDDKYLNGFISLDKRMVIIIDMEKLFNGEDFNCF